jgi:hypothetical protein
LIPLDGRALDQKGVYIMPRTAKVASDGSFSFETSSVSYPTANKGQVYGTAAFGRYRIIVNGLPEQYCMTRAIFNSRDVLDSGFDISNDVVPGPLSIRVERNAATISGTVHNSKNEVVPDSIVALIPTLERRMNLALFHTVRTDQHGNFTVRQIAPGNYGILALEGVESVAFENAEFVKDYENKMSRLTILPGTANNSIINVIPNPN